MEVNNELVNNIAHLARLHFTENEKKEIGKDLQRMISFVEKLNEIDTTGNHSLQVFSNLLFFIFCKMQACQMGYIIYQFIVYFHTNKNKSSLQYSPEKCGNGK